MEVNEVREVGALSLIELRQLKKAIQTHHARYPGQRVAVKHDDDTGSVHVWRLR